MSRDYKGDGPAFPTLIFNGDTDQPYDQQPGLTLRDYFAAQALAGLLACMNNQENVNAVLDMAQQADRHPKQQLAFSAYQYADAMLEARR